MPAARPAARRWAGAACVLGAIASLLMGPAAVVLLRHELRISCSLVRFGSAEPEWVCVDGIGYIGAGLMLASAPLAAAGTGALVALRWRHRWSARLVLTLLAVVVVAWHLGWTWQQSGPRVDGADGQALWREHVGPAALVTATALASALVALLVRTWVPSLLAAAVMAWATVIQPGLGLATVTACSLLVAATLRAGEGLRAAMDETFLPPDGTSTACRPQAPQAET